MKSHKITPVAQDDAQAVAVGIGTFNVVFRSPGTGQSVLHDFVMRVENLPGFVSLKGEELGCLVSCKVNTLQELAVMILPHTCSPVRGSGLRRTTDPSLEGLSGLFRVVPGCFKVPVDEEAP